MSALLPAEPRWGIRHWLYAVGAVLLLQVLLLAYFGQRTPAPAPVRAGFRTAIHFLDDPRAGARLNDLPGAGDPTLLALPSRLSFSGPGWLRGRDLGYQPEPWSESPRWLGLEARDLGRELAGLMATNGVATPTIADRPAPPLLRFEPRFPSEPLPAQSRLRAEGAVAARPLRFLPVLPPWPHADLLSNSVVQVVVDADGYPLSAEPVSGCGLPEADRQAVRLAMAVRFEPRPRAGRDDTGRGPLDWGRLIFLWATLPMAATNGTAALP